MIKNNKASLDDKYAFLTEHVKDVSADPDDPSQQQCLHCVHYVPLKGILGADYGVCLNSYSLYAGTIQFEHNGCIAHVENKDY